MPFDRLIRALDKWARNHPEEEVFAQIGQTDFKPSNMRYCSTVTPQQFREWVATCRLVVAHAGMGSVITSLELGRPLVLMPRRGNLNETRNDHQIATARWLKNTSGITVAMDDEDLSDAVDRALALTTTGAGSLELKVNTELIQFIAGYLDNINAKRQSSGE